MVHLPGSPDDRATDARVSAAEGRDEVAAARDGEAEARDRRAEDRDEVATARDAAADARDRAAAGRARARADRAVHDPGAGTHPTASAPPTDRAAADPAAVSARALASRDRERSGKDRVDAAGDRHAASADRGASASDRAAAALDELTGAHRRGPGFVELEREMARARRARQGLVLAFVDVNGLKAVNDSRGHAAGDQVLREVVATLRAKLRDYDLIVRFGGDEFLCAIPGISMTEAAARLAAVNTSLSDSAEPASVAIGLADMRADDSFRDLIARADAALYEPPEPDAVIDLTKPPSSPVEPALRHET